MMPGDSTSVLWDQRSDEITLLKYHQGSNFSCELQPVACPDLLPHLIFTAFEALCIGNEEKVTFFLQ